MNKNVFQLLVIFLCSFAWTIGTGQVPAYVWGHSWGSPANESVISIELDAQRNVYAVGRFHGTIDFDPGPDTVSMTSLGPSNSVYIIKFNPDGQFLWVKVIGSSLGMDVTGIVKSPDDNYLITGAFSGEADFDPGPGQFLVSANNLDTYLLKIDPEGQLLWAKAIGGDGDEYFSCLSFDADGNIIAGGFFFGTTDLDPGPNVALFTFMGQAIDGIDMFAAKYSSTGDYIWGKQFPGDSLAFFNDLNIDTGGNLFFLGAFYDVRDFDPGPDSVILNTAGEADIFVLKLNSTGDYQWVKQIGGTGDDGGNGFVRNENGDLLITGYFHNEVDFDPGPGFQLFSADQMDMYLVSLDHDGEFEWLHTIGGNSNDFARVIRTDPTGNLFVMGYFADTVDFDPGVEVHSLSEIGQTTKPDAFILKLDPSGDYRWAYQLGGPGTDRGTEVRFALEGREIFITGLFEQKAVLSPGLSGTDTVTAIGARDVFLAKWTQCEESFAEIFHISCGDYTSPSGDHTWTESGVYTDTIQNKAGCDSIITINLSIVDLGLTIVQSGDTLFGDGGASQFWWIDCDHNNETVGSGNVFIPEKNGNYALVGAGFACTDTSECYSFVMTGTEESTVTVDFELYPNPAHHYFEIDLHHSYSDVQLEIFNSLGVRVYNENFYGQKRVGVETDFTAGLYLVLIIAGDRREIFKVLLE